MKKQLHTLIVASALMVTAQAQTQLNNPGFENWGGNASPGVASEPTNWYSNKSGSSVATIGPQTCFQDMTEKHSGTSSARIETIYFIVAVVNGNLTTGVINAPSTNKAEGYIGTINYSNAADIRRTPFNARPDSLTGWYRYTQATGPGNTAAEQGKVRVILHTGNYFDPETPANGNHPDSSANKIGDALFLTPMADVTTWTRFSVPFSYVSGANPAYVMVNITSSNNQTTTVPSSSSSTGSKLWIDDLEMIYNNGTGIAKYARNTIKVYANQKSLMADFSNNTSKAQSIQISDVTGRVIASYAIEASQLNTFDLSAFNTGIYLYQLKGNEGVLQSGKFILE